MIFPRNSLFCLVALISTIGAAQKGSAPNGYYPPSYGGLTFTGEVTAINEQDQTLTLTYTHGNKSETFVGRLQAPCAVNGKGGARKAITVANLAPGTELTAYYSEISKKVNGSKVKENVIVGVSVSKFHGQKIDPSERLLSYCTDQKSLEFKGW